MHSRIALVVRLTILIGTILGLSAGSSMATVPEMLNFQAILLDSDGGTVADSTYQLVFRIYDDSTGGVPLWMEVQVVTTQNGLFNTFLGQAVAIPGTVFDSPDRWLEIELEGVGPYLPRTRFGSVAYAYRVESVNGANGGIITGPVGIQATDNSAAAVITNLANGDGLRVHGNVSQDLNWGAIWATNTGSSPTISVEAGTGLAGYFDGNVMVTESLAVVGPVIKGGGSFRIDHPLDPENKYLFHSFVESPDMMNIYNGNVILDGSGEAIVALPDYFDALNRDFRYQLTCVGAYAPVYVADEIAGRQFRIAGGTPGLKVSWQVTGIRKDAYANANRIPVELDKPAAERGKYLHPTAHGLPESMGIYYRGESRERKPSAAHSILGGVR